MKLFALVVLLLAGPAWASTPTATPLQTPVAFPDFATGTQAAYATPSAGKQALGWVSAEKPPYQYFNWLHRFTAQWLHYLSDKTNAQDVSISAATVRLDTYNVTNTARLDAFNATSTANLQAIVGLGIHQSVFLTPGTSTFTFTGGTAAFTFTVKSDKWGAGGGGGGGDSSSSNGGGGGGSGEFVQGVHTVYVGQVITVQVGAGGVGGDYLNDGTDGGATSITGWFVADGGKGGKKGQGGTGAGGAGGGTAGTPTIAAGVLRMGGNTGGSKSGTTGGVGGSLTAGSVSEIGKGGAATASDGGPGTGIGAGGAGGKGTAVGSNGGAGAPGGVILTY